MLTAAVASGNELLVRLLAEPSSDAVVHVYSDWLQTHGLAQGELITLQRRRRLATDRGAQRKLRLSEQRLLAAHPEELYGSLFRATDLDAVWRDGFVRELRLSLPSRKALQALTEALRTSSYVQLEQLDLTLPRQLSLEALMRALPPSLRTLQLRSLDAELDWAPVLEALPELSELALSGGRGLNLEGFTLPGLERLHLGVGHEPLLAQSLPDLKLLEVDHRWLGEDYSDLEGLRLLRIVGDDHAYDSYDVAAPTGARVVLEGWSTVRADASDLPYLGGALHRLGVGRAFERAFVLTSAAPAAITEAVAATLRLDGAAPGVALHAELSLPFQAVQLVELRGPALEPTLHAQLAARLSSVAPLAVEVMLSNSNRDVLLRQWRAESARALAMGPYARKDELWRAGLDQALGYDPGHSLGAATAALDVGVALLGEPLDDEEWPCASELPPRASFRLGPDQELDLDLDGGDDDLYDEDEAPPGDGWTPAAQTEPAELFEAPAGLETDRAEADELELADEVGPDTATTDEAHLLAESPVELEDDGTERLWSFGLEDDAFDPDTLAAEAPECQRCGALAHPACECRVCHRTVCPSCTEPSDADEDPRCSRCVP